MADGGNVGARGGWRRKALVFLEDSSIAICVVQVYVLLGLG